LPSQGYELRVSVPATVSYFSFWYELSVQIQWHSPCIYTQNPVNVILWLEEGEEEGGGGEEEHNNNNNNKGALAGTGRPRGRRSLLDAEKVMFITGPNGWIVLNRQENKHAIVGFRAMARGVFKDSSRFPVLYYDIVLERNVVGIPFSAWPLLLTAVIVVMVKFYFTYLNHDESSAHVDFSTF